MLFKHCGESVILSKSYVYFGFNKLGFNFVIYFGFNKFDFYFVHRAWTPLMRARSTGQRSIEAPRGSRGGTWSPPLPKRSFPAEAFKKVLREGVRAELRTRRAKCFVQLGAIAEVRHGADGSGCDPLVVPGLSALGGR